MKVVEGFVIGVLSSIAALLIIPSLLGTGTHSSCLPCETARGGISAISTGLTLYGLDNGYYPNNENVFNELLVNGLLGRMPKDPWGNKYQYSLYYTPLYTCFIVWSFGSDEKPGGQKESERDIYNPSSVGSCIINQKTYSSA